MAVTANEKAYMASAAGMNYDVLTDEYIMPDGRRISAVSTMQGSIGYGQLTAPGANGPTGPLPAPQQQNGWSRSLDDLSFKPIDHKKDIIQDIVGKIKDKYKDRDLIMIKTADLIRLIESV